MQELIAVENGENLEEYRHRKDIQQRLANESEKYIDTSPASWPEIKFNWDTSKESQVFSLDAMSKNEFKEYYPKGFILGHVSLTEFDKVIGHYSRRDEGELWEVGCKSKLSRLIGYLSEGHPISPLVANPTEFNEIILQGGHHRYAIAKVVGEVEIPIHAEPESKDAIDRLVSVRWHKV